MSAHPFARAVGCAAAVLLIATTAASQSTPPRRIVSLAPSVTEVLFEAGLGPRVVGVTSYCRYPADVLPIAKVGGYLTPSYEALVALHPDLVVVLPEHEDVEPRIARLGLTAMRVDHRSLSGIIDSIITLGERAGEGARARPAADALRARLSRTEAIGAYRVRPRVLVVFGRSDDLRQFYAAAPGTVHDDLLRHAGGQNVLTSSAVPYPTLSAESVMRLDPDVVVEFAPGSFDGDARRRQWDLLRPLKAVKTDRVYVFTEDFLSVPGPRFVRFAETLARALHREGGARW
jgi:iron complex transport system substrate-binding protein